jgi:hypothetical protein
MTKWQRIQEERRRAKAERTGYPNRRGDYRDDNSGNRKEKWKRHRVRLFKNKWQVVDAPDFRHSYKSGARHSWAHSIGARNRRKWKQEREAQQVGFQREFAPIEKPKVPGRILRDAQEAELWELECDA